MNITMMNITLRVASYYACESLEKYHQNEFDPVWRHTVKGCQILNILQDVYRFKVLYTHIDAEENMTIGEDGLIEYPESDIIDIYLRPMNFRPNFLEHMYPIHTAYQWRYGFIFRRTPSNFYRTFYSQPFTRPLWNCLYTMALVVSIFFYLQKRWERRIVGGSDTSFTNELLMVIGAYCQHIPPIDPILPSRRIAYFVFLMFAYLVYTYYTSNLLSHLVNDKDLSITLEMMAQSDLKIVIVDYMKLENMASTTYSHNYSIVYNKLRNLKSIPAMECLQLVRQGQFAVLSDFISLNALIQRITHEVVWL